jgi:hypothetical protein
LFKAGLAMLIAGYGIAAVSATVGTFISDDSIAKYGATCLNPGLAFIPLFGPFAALGTYAGHQVVGYGDPSSPYVLDCDGPRGGVTALVLVDEVLQLGGAGLIVAGLLWRSPDAKRPEPATRVEVLPGAPHASLGVTLRVSGL